LKQQLLPGHKTIPVNIFRWAVGLLVTAMLPGLFNTLMEPDAALYAGISKQMVLRGDWINLYARGTDWLDKPHLPFWIVAAGYKLFGINTFAYKFPAFICWMLGAYYTYLFAVRFYGRDIGRLSVLIYLSALHGIISMNDVKAEPYLTLFLMAAGYHLMRAKREAMQILPAAFFTACALMTKGPFVLIPLGAGLWLDWIIKKEWQQFWQARWYLYLLLTCILTLPEIYAVYQQFDLQPGKLVFGKHAVSGVQFFLWESQFGRFFNTGPIKGKGDFFFFFHTLLWAFLPWSLLLYAAIYQVVKHIKKGKEHFSTGAILATMLIFSLSRFQLPHYLLILFPFFGIVLADWFIRECWYEKKAVQIIQKVIAVLMLILPLAVCIIFRGNYWYGFLPVFIAGIYLSLFNNRIKRQVVALSMVGSISIAIFLNVFFYPPLLLYQGGSEAARWKNAQLPGAVVQMYSLQSFSFEFYADANVIWADSISTKTPYLFTNKRGAAELGRLGIEADTLAIFPNYRITKLKMKFLLPGQRERVIDSVYMLRLGD